jgi:hypothetical protein
LFLDLDIFLGNIKTIIKPLSSYGIREH